MENTSSRMKATPAPPSADRSVKKVQADRLLFLGVVLFLLGLISGLLTPQMGSPRLGLSSHLEGVMNGLVLMVLGLMWPRIDLPDMMLKLTFYAVINGTFANWGGVMVGAIWNAGGMMHVASGHVGPQMAEIAVRVLLYSVVVCMIYTCVAVMWGLHRGSRVNRV